tara:strand:- start:107006 stop:107224 length:219 start_codon:yes stop_codon:yes gene_type:complete
MFKKLCLGLIRLYQLTLSPLFGSLGVQCRFHPTCSSYATQAFTKYAPTKAFWLTFKRILKCHPFHPGGVDEP